MTDQHALFLSTTGFISSSVFHDSLLRGPSIAVTQTAEVKVLTNIELAPLPLCPTAPRIASFAMSPLIDTS